MAISIADLIKQNTLGQSEGFPLGVPTSYNWYPRLEWRGSGNASRKLHRRCGLGASLSGSGATSGFKSKCRRSKSLTRRHTFTSRQQANGYWFRISRQPGLTGGHFATDFSGNAATAMPATALPGGGTIFDAPAAGQNDHFWHGSRGTYAAGTVDAVYVQMDMRVTDPNAHLIGMVGADWWRDASAPFVADHSTNPGAGAPTGSSSRPNGKRSATIP